MNVRTLDEVIAEAARTGQPDETSSSEAARELRDLRARVLASAERGGFGMFADRVGRLFGISRTDAEAFLQRVERNEGFVQVAEGIDVAPLNPSSFALDGSGKMIGIARFGAGVVFPRHVHKGDEVTFVLHGGFVDESGATVERGQEFFKAKGTSHGFTIMAATHCIAAVYAEQGIDFT